MVKDTPLKSTGFNVVLVSRSFDGKQKLRGRGWSATRVGGERIIEALIKRAPSCADGDYRVLSQRQLKELQKKLARKQASRRAAGAKKAAATRKKNGKAAFILCPYCDAKSKKLFSEFGGLQTRRCQGGHRFEYDKWIADRAFWGLALAGRCPNPYVR